MRLFDFRVTICGATFFLRLFCQYPGVFYYLMVAATFRRHDLSWSIKKPAGKPIGPRDLFKIYAPNKGEAWQH